MAPFEGGKWEILVDIYEVTNQQYADALNWAWGRADQVLFLKEVVQ